MEIGSEVIFQVKKSELSGVVTGIDENYIYIRSNSDNYYIPKNLVKLKQ